ncbi:hypothetical protein RCL_jg10551.t1 [Rhizophagus clarus]|uniref:Uncharacterized protein n=1 Tax=Rhizophagus clarus TaxID=94130 RepID=A0A8H3L834_9GLOM|nr:hypothetical protein RCL_jg10551.t1 [Rhizophagus clarus]
MAFNFNLPSYTGGQLAHPTTIPQNITPGNLTDREYSNAVIYTSDVINCYRYGDATESDVASGGKRKIISLATYKMPLDQRCKGL